jgi:hypothetical protein
MPVLVHRAHSFLSPLGTRQRAEASPGLTASSITHILSRVGWMAQMPGELHEPWPFSSLDAVPVSHPLTDWSAYAP